MKSRGIALLFDEQYLLRQIRLWRLSTMYRRPRRPYERRTNYARR